MSAGLTASARGGNPLSPTESYLHVIHALMLRDMRTRFGGTLWGYAVVVLWPCVHIFYADRLIPSSMLPVPFGNSSSLFFATVAVPVLIFQYISRR